LIFLATPSLDKSRKKMSSKIVQPTSFNVSKVTLSKTKDSKAIAGFKSAFLNYNGDNKLYVQTPSLPTPFGLSAFTGNKDQPAQAGAGAPKYTLDLNMRGYDNNPKVQAFYTLLKDLDNYMIDQGVKNSVAWFGKAKSREVVEDNYNAMLKQSVNKKTGEAYDPSVKVKVQYKRDNTNEFDCEVFNNKNEPLEDTLVETLKEAVKARSEVTCVIECTGLYVQGTGKFGLGWKLIQARIDKSSGSSGLEAGRPAFVDEDGEADEAPAAKSAFKEPAEFGSSASASSEAPKTLADKKKALLEAASDDDSEEEVAPAPTPAKAVKAPEPAPDSGSESEEEVAPAPVPVAKKPIVMTKKTVVKKAAGK
jgi:hypothetical protein